MTYSQLGLICFGFGLFLFGLCYWGTTASGRRNAELGPVLVFDRDRQVLSLPRLSKSFNVEEVDCLCLVTASQHEEPVYEFQLQTKSGERHPVLASTAFYQLRCLTRDIASRATLFVVEQWVREGRPAKRPKIFGKKWLAFWSCAGCVVQEADDSVEIAYSSREEIWRGFLCSLAALGLGVFGVLFVLSLFGMGAEVDLMSVFRALGLVCLLCVAGLAAWDPKITRKFAADTICITEERGKPLGGRKHFHFEWGEIDLVGIEGQGAWPNNVCYRLYLQHKNRRQSVIMVSDSEEELDGIGRKLRGMLEKSRGL